MVHLESVGWCRQTGFGATGISYTEIEAYQRLMGFFFTPWEAETLFKLSAIFAATSNTASDPKTPAPFDIETTDSRNKRITDKIFG